MASYKYSVTVMEHTIGGDDHARNTWHLFTGRTLEEAWRICEKHARRGVKRFGGNVNRLNWGMRGGQFPETYRSATIRPDV
jgi:hypothetical protein